MSAQLIQDDTNHADGTAGHNALVLESMGIDIPSLPFDVPTLSAADDATSDGGREASTCYGSAHSAGLAGTTALLCESALAAACVASAASTSAEAHGADDLTLADATTPAILAADKPSPATHVVARLHTSLALVGHGDARSAATSSCATHVL